MSMALTMNRQLTEESVSTKNFIPDGKRKDFMRERAQAKSITTKSNKIGEINNFDFTDLEKGKEIHVWLTSSGSERKNCEHNKTERRDSRNSSVGEKKKQK